MLLFVSNQNRKEIMEVEKNIILTSLAFEYQPIHGGQVVEEFTLQVDESLAHPYSVYPMRKFICIKHFQKYNKHVDVKEERD